MLARFPRRTNLTLVGAVALVLAIANPAAAPPGDLDPSFDGDGKVTTDFTGGFDYAYAVVIQGDGKIIAAGRATVGSDVDFGLARYNPDGSLDTTFDSDGKVSTKIGGTDEVFAVTIQGDGKIVAAGISGIGGVLARYNADGSLDTTFDGDGLTTTNFGGSSGAARAVVIQGDGKIAVAGDTSVAGNRDFAMARYNPDGSLDTTFDGDGLTTTDFAGSTDFALGMALQGDGRILAAGQTGSACGDCAFALARYNADGSLDTTFDTDGMVTTDFGGFDAARAVSVQGDGKIVAAGFASFNDFALARYNADGSLDSGFDTDGKVTTNFGGSGDSDQALDMAIQTNGKIVAAGFTGFSSTEDFALARYNTDGSLDTSFNVDGRVTTDIAAGQDRAEAVAIQSNGRIVAAGGAFVTGNFDFALARYTCLRRTSRPMSIPICP